MLYTERMKKMLKKKTVCLLSFAVLAFVLTACSNYADYHREGAIYPPARTSYQNTVNRRATTRNSNRHRVEAENRERPSPKQNAPSRFIPRDRTRVETPAHANTNAPPKTSAQQPHLGFAPQPTPVAPEPTTAPQKAENPTQTAPAITTPPKAEPAPDTQSQTTSKRELASHKTEFNAKEENRANNIRRASDSINGHVVKPGETFSYNQTVGPTNEKRGYKESIIIVDGEKEKGVGGGVCQVSTTLSIAADDAGMTITERHDHSRAVTYAQEGDEAATSYGGIDFKFKNEKSHSIVINSSVQGGTITVSICEV